MPDDDICWLLMLVNYCIVNALVPTHTFSTACLGGFSPHTASIIFVYIIKQSKLGITFNLQLIPIDHRYLCIQRIYR